ERMGGQQPLPWLRHGHAGGRVEHRRERIRGCVSEKRRPQRSRWAAWTPKIRRGAPPGPLMLAMAAEDGGAACDSDHAQRASTCEARLAGAAIDQQLFLLSADLSPRVAVRVDRAASIRDRGLPRSPKRLMKSPR